MRKIVVAIFTLATLLSACKKKDINKGNDGHSNSLKIEGEWQLMSVNFLSENANWDESVEYNVQNYFGHAPSMFQLVLGFDFLTQKVEGNLGNKLIIYNDGQEHEQNTSSDTWYWNYTDDNKSWEMTQINSDMPPYDFSIMNIHKVEVTETGKTISFNAELNSRIPGKSMSTTQILPVEMEITKGKAEDNALVYILGEEFDW